MVLSSILAIIDIGLNLQKSERKPFQFPIHKQGPGIGIVRIYGSIRVPTKSGSVLGTDGADAIIKRISKFEEDSNIKAIVVRINSPGGTVAATQEIFNKLMELRKKNMTLVASMGDIAASGGYYIASACNYIFANHGTITGSIGVIAVSPNLKELFEKIGIKMNVIKSGKHKDLLALYRDLSHEEFELIQQIVDSSYNQFLKDVARGRNLAISDIKSYADGRVMNGDTAYKYKLIDEIGSFEDAINKARKLAKLPPDCTIYDDDKTPLEQIFMSLESIFKRESGFEKQINHSKFPMLLEYSIEP